MNYKRSAKDIAAELGSDIDNGLTIKKAHERIHSRGRNVVRVPAKMNAFVGMSRHIFSLMNIILIAVAAVHFVTGGVYGKYMAAFFVLCAAANTVVGYINLRRDSSPLRILGSMQNDNVTVIRNGIKAEVPAMLLAQGDVFLLSAGQTVPADAKIIECSGVVVDETILNGDGGSVTKSDGGGYAVDENETVVFMGTRLVSGSLKAIITATGRNTQIGSTMGLMTVNEDKVSSLARKNASIGNIFGVVAILVWLAALLLRLAWGYGMTSAFENSVYAAVSVMPVTLPPLVLLTMNLNALKLRKRGVEPRSASAVDTLGASTMLCVGKRGTLTQQSFEVSELRPGNGLDANKLRLLAAMCTTADISGDRPVGDPMQTALIEDAVKHGCTIAEIRKTVPTEMVLDNHRENRLMTTVHKTEHGHIVICKGAPDAVAAWCGKIYDGGVRDFDAARDLSSVIEESNRMAAKAMSVMAVAFKETVYAPEQDETSLKENLIFAGLIGLSTAIRKDTPAAVKQLQSMGVRTCLITNENLTTAAAVAEQSGIPTGGIAQGAGVDCSNIRSLRRTSVFADIGARQKAEIVAALNEKENVIVVGRGIRDISAMNSADVSVTTDAGAKICSAAADVRIAGAGLGRIAEAVKECKRTFLNVERMIGFLLTCGIAQAFCALGALAMGYSTPFSSVGAVWLELAICVAASVGIWCEPYHRSPVKRTELNTMKSGRLSRSVFRTSVLRGLLLGFCAMAVYKLTEGRLGSDMRRGAVMLTLCVGFTLMGQSWRSAGPTLKRAFSNPAALVCLALNAAVCVLTVAARPIRDLLYIEVPDGGTVAVCVLAGAIPFLLAELVKLAGSVSGKKRPAKKRKGAANER